MTIDRETANNLKPVTCVAGLFSVPAALYLAMADKSLLVLLGFPLFFGAAFLFCLVFLLLAYGMREALSSLWVLIEALMERSEKG